MPISPITTAYKLGVSTARWLPGGLAEWLARVLGPVLSLVMDSRRSMVARHQHRALQWRAKLEREAACTDTNAATNTDANTAGNFVSLLETRRATREAFTSYVRYWLELFRLPYLSAEVLDDGFGESAYITICECLKSGKGVIVALPHLGGWEWAGFWLAKVKHHRITVVVEPLDPPELFEWFAGFRRSLGMNVVPVGPDAGAEVLAALKRNEIVCLLSDRDISGDGIEVDFMGERTKLPAGPALLALRTGAPLMPAMVYSTPSGGHVTFSRPVLASEREGKLRQDVARVTQQMADELGLLIASAPQQWHMFGPNWPSDLA